MSGQGGLLESVGLSGNGNFFEDLVSAGLNYGTGGLVGLKDGKLGGGATVQFLSNVGRETMAGVKDITGAKAAEEANKQAMMQMEEQRAAALQERQNQQARTASDQMRQSRAAGAARGNPRAANRNSMLGTSSMDDETDFLGV